MIRLILISLAGVRLQSKQDSHCESCFDFGLTPGFEASKARDTGSSQYPLPFLLASVEEVIPTLLTRTIKSTKISYLMYKTKITSVSIITTIATSNRCELDSLENLFSRDL